jgi:hypothetical protein
MTKLHNWQPFAKGEIGGDDDRSALIEPADQVEEQLAAGLRERQIAELVEHDKIHASEVFGKTTLPIATGFVFQPVDEVDDGVETAASATANAGAGDGNGEMRFFHARDAAQQQRDEF